MRLCLAGGWAHCIWLHNVSHFLPSLHLSGTESVCALLIIVPSHLSPNHSVMYNLHTWHCALYASYRNSYLLVEANWLFLTHVTWQLTLLCTWQWLVCRWHTANLNVGGKQHLFVSFSHSWPRELYNSSPAVSLCHKNEASFHYDTHSARNACCNYSVVSTTSSFTLLNLMLELLTNEILWLFRDLFGSINVWQLAKMKAES